MGTWSYFLVRKLDLPLNSSTAKGHCILQRATDVVDVKLFTKFYTTRESNDRQTFDWMNSIKFKAGLYQTLDVSNSKRIHQCLCYDFADRKI